MVERSGLVGIRLKNRCADQDSLEELKRLAESAGAIVVETWEQQVERFQPATLLGRGKLEEIKKRVSELNLDIVIFDQELSPIQHRNVEEELGVKVVDRTGLILDIFAQRARSREGKIQVETAQLSYLLPRLTGRGSILSRLGGGIGTRGPGETKLEIDRRWVRQRLQRLQRELQRVAQTREVQREKRTSRAFPALALVGYTNSGKSTLLNRLGRAKVPTADRLFSTLDPTIRRAYLGEGVSVALVDTVGIIQKLPHFLVAAFRSTFEEIRYATGILLVLDAANPKVTEQAETVHRVLEEVGITPGKKPFITVLNKKDLIRSEHERTWIRDRFGSPAVWISALTGEGVDELKSEIRRVLKTSWNQL